ncbi:MAG: FG-GAP repeat protein, partial [Bacteroidota bacterium]|nr:FG-GAP repeat protein [Bacteroidota bacterium]
NNLFGWWQTLAVADVNGDGLQDLILGNIGENCYIHPDPTHPVKLWLNDFDENNVSDRILTSTIDGKDMPVFLKHDMEDQIPGLKKKSLKHKDYATKTIQELFTPDIIKSCVVKQFNYPASIIAINEGNGKFRIQKLPMELQLSSVNAIHSTDLNGDGKPDLIMGGNEYGFLPQFERLDASNGSVLLNMGKGEFQLLSNDASGVDLNGQIRDIQEIKTEKGKELLFLRNDMYPVLFRLSSATPKPSTKTAGK